MTSTLLLRLGVTITLSDDALKKTGEMIALAVTSSQGVEGSSEAGLRGKCESPGDPFFHSCKCLSEALGSNRFSQIVQCMQFEGINSVLRVGLGKGNPARHHKRRFATAYKTNSPDRCFSY